MKSDPSEYKSIIETLHEKTRQRRVEWEQDIPDSFRCKLGSEHDDSFSFMLTYRWGRRFAPFSDYAGRKTKRNFPYQNLLDRTQSLSFQEHPYRLAAGTFPSVPVGMVVTRAPGLVPWAAAACAAGGLRPSSLRTSASSLA
jgi:hypothetical protein